MDVRIRFHVAMDMEATDDPILGDLVVHLPSQLEVFFAGREDSLEKEHDELELGSDMSVTFTPGSDGDLVSVGGPIVGMEGAWSIARPLVGSTVWEQCEFLIEADEDADVVMEVSDAEVESLRANWRAAHVVARSGRIVSLPRSWHEVEQLALGLGERGQRRKLDLGTGKVTVEADDDDPTLQ